MMLKTALFFALATWPLTLFAGDLQDEGLKQVQAKVGEHCAVTLVESRLILVGFNGFRIENWQVSTCSGPAEYEIRYYPPQYFPDRTNPFEVRKLDAGRIPSTRPNNSFKPKPLRGSA